MIEGGDSGGHNGFDQNAEDTGFEYLVQEQKKVLQNKGYQGDIQQEAFFLSLPIFKKRHAMNEAYWNSELQRETETVTSYEIRYNEERKQYEMYHPEYETFLQDMLARTKRYAEEKNQPQVFNKEESNSIIQAERALISGEATSILYPVWHEGGKVRYITEMTIDGGRVKNKYVDIGKIAGKDLSREEAVQMLQDLRNLHDGHAEKKDDHGPYSILVLKDGEIGFKEIAMTTVKNVNDGKDEKSQETWPVPKRLAEEDVYRRPTYMVKNADRKGEIYFWNGIVGEHGLLGTLQIAERMYKEKFVPFIRHKREGKKDIGEAKKKERRTENVQKDVNAVVSRIEKQKEKSDEKKESIIFAQKTGVGVGGALFLLDALTQPVSPLTKKEKQELRRIKRSERSVLRARLKKKERVQREDAKLQSERGMQKPRNCERKKKTYKEIKRRRYREKKRLRDKEIKRFRKRETGNIIFLRKEKKRSIDSKEKRKKENLLVHGKEIGLLVALDKITRKIRSEYQRGKRKPERKIKLHRKEKQDAQERKDGVRKTVLEFIRAWILFSLYKYNFHGKPSLENMGTVVFRKKIGKEEQSCQESSPWILLSIIWYLTMIREQGKVPILPKKKKKKKKPFKKKRCSLGKKFQQLMFQQGVIYAYQY